MKKQYIYQKGLKILLTSARALAPSKRSSGLINSSPLALFTFNCVCYIWFDNNDFEWGSVSKSTSTVKRWRSLFKIHHYIPWQRHQLGSSYRQPLAPDQKVFCILTTSLFVIPGCQGWGTSPEQVPGSTFYLSQRCLLSQDRRCPD